VLFETIKLHHVVVSEKQVSSASQKRFT